MMRAVIRLKRPCAPARLLLAALAAAIVLLAAAQAVFPAQAHARYSDASTEYPASQEISTSGQAIYVSQIPEGTYDLTASTSSYMCNLYNCVLTVSGGYMWVDFDTTGSYTAIYPGTAEQAAALSGESGEDTSSYIMGDPPEGYVTHHYQLYIDSLNTIITLATYSGGSRGDAGLWYTRSVVFNSTEAIDLAVQNRQSQDTDDTQDGGDGGDDGQSSDTGSGSSEGGSSGTGTSGSGTSTGSSTAAGSTGTGSGSSDTSGDGDSSQSSSGKIYAQNVIGSRSANSGTEAVLLSIAELDSGGSGITVAHGQEADDVGNIWPVVLVALCCAAAACLASGILITRSSRKYLNPAALAEDEG